MSMTGLDSFDTTVQKSNIWLKEILDDRGWDDRHKAYLALRSVLHAIRDRLTVDEAVHLGAQLPMLLRGMYYEGWNPSKSPLKIRTKEEFLASIEQKYERAQPGLEPDEALTAVLHLLCRKISDGEMEDVKNSFPADIQELWPQPSVH
ncbi:MAG: DUF2267 domain-containing protein [Syntrophobacteraceae bacterium]